MDRFNYHLHPGTQPYNNYIGSKLYKFSIKYLGKSQLLGLELADLPASITLGVIYGLSVQNVRSGIAFALAHQLTFPLFLYAKHQYHVKKRNERTRSIDDYVI